MELKNQNILFFTRTMGLGGTENVVIQLCETFLPLVNKIVVCSSGGDKVEQLNKMGIKHYMIPDIGNKSPATILKIASELPKIVKKENITVIHTHHRMAAFYVTFLRLYNKCIFINTSHNNFYDKVKFTRYAFKKANLVACGKMVKQNLGKVYHLNGVTAIRNGIKPYTEEIIPDSMIKQLHDNGNIVIGNVGRLSEQKGMKYFIEAIPLVLARCSNAKFVIVGDGEQKQELKSEVEKLGIKDSVYFLGYRSDIQNLMSQMDFVVLSSLWEGLPLTPIEAFSVGKTVVATAVDGTTEIVKDGENGILVKPGNVDSLANGIISAVTSDRHQLEENAKNTFETKFSYDVFARQYINFYKKILGQENERTS